MKLVVTEKSHYNLVCSGYVNRSKSILEPGALTFRSTQINFGGKKNKNTEKLF